MPDPLARVGLKRQHAIGEEVCADAIAAPMIVGSRAGARKHQAAPRIERHPAPAIGAPDRFPSVRRPGLVPKLARMRDGVENPATLPAPRVEGADVTGRGGSGTFSNHRTQDEQIFINNAGRRGADRKKKHVAIQPVPQVQLAARTERRNELAIGRVQRAEVAPRDEKNPPVLAIGPVGDTAIDTPPALSVPWVKSPAGAAGRGVERYDLQTRRGQEHHAIHHDGIALNRTRRLKPHILAMMDPNRFEPLDVGAIDLVEGGILFAGRIAAIHLPAASILDRVRHRCVYSQAKEPQPDSGM